MNSLPMPPQGWNIRSVIPHSLHHSHFQNTSHYYISVPTNTHLCSPHNTLPLLTSKKKPTLLRWPHPPKPSSTFQYHSIPQPKTFLPHPHLPNTHTHSSSKTPRPLTLLHDLTIKQASLSPPIPSHYSPPQAFITPNSHTTHH